MTNLKITISFLLSRSIWLQEENLQGIEKAALMTMQFSHRRLSDCDFEVYIPVSGRTFNVYLDPWWCLGTYGLTY